jgi:transposase
VPLLLSLPSTVRMFADSQPTDMRKRFDGFAAIVSKEFSKNLFAEDDVVFFKRSLDRSKILLQDRDGLVIRAKRFKPGRFQHPLHPAEERSTGPRLLDCEGPTKLPCSGLLSHRFASQATPTQPRPLVPRVTNQRGLNPWIVKAAFRPSLETKESRPLGSLERNGTKADVLITITFIDDTNLVHGEPNHA